MSMFAPSNFPGTGNANNAFNPTMMGWGTLANVAQGIGDGYLGYFDTQQAIQDKLQQRQMNAAKMAQMKQDTADMAQQAQQRQTAFDRGNAQQNYQALQGLAQDAFRRGDYDTAKTLSDQMRGNFNTGYNANLVGPAYQGSTQTMNNPNAQSDNAFDPSGAAAVLMNSGGGLQGAASNAITGGQDIPDFQQTIQDQQQAAENPPMVAQNANPDWKGNPANVNALAETIGMPVPQAKTIELDSKKSLIEATPKPDGSYSYHTIQDAGRIDPDRFKVDLKAGRVFDTYTQQYTQFAPPEASDAEKTDRLNTALDRITMATDSGNADRDLKWTQGLAETQKSAMQAALTSGQTMEQAKAAAQQAGQMYMQTVPRPKPIDNPLHPSNYSTQPSGIGVPSTSAGPVNTQVQYPASGFPTSAAEQKGGTQAWAPLVNAAATKYGVDPALINYIMGKESGGAQWNPDGTLKRGPAIDPKTGKNIDGVGLMQVVPDIHGASEAQLADPRTNIDTAARLIRGLLDANHGNVQAAMSAYNGSGPDARAYGADVVRHYKGPGYYRAQAQQPQQAPQQSQAPSAPSGATQRMQALLTQF